MSDTVIVIRGTLDWAKITGKARPYTGNPKYDKGPYWSLDITPDAKSRALIKANGISEKLRDPKGEKDTRKESFISLKHLLKNQKTGEENAPPKVVDIQGNPWSGGLIGNGSVADVKVKIKDYGSGSEKGVYLQAVRILSHVPYESNDFDPVDEDDEFFAEGRKVADKAVAPKDDEFETSDTKSDDLDDDVPF